MLKDIEYVLTGELDNGTVEGRGRGSLNEITGEAELSVNFNQVPAGWDPRTIALICCYRACAVGAEEFEAASNLLTLSSGRMNMGIDLKGVSRRGIIYREGGELLTDISAFADSSFLNKDTYDRSFISHGHSSLFPGVNGIAKINTPFSGLMMQAGPGLVTLNTAYTVQLEDGTTAHGTTYYPHFLPNQRNAMNEPQEFRMEKVENHLAGKTLEVYTKASVRPLQVRTAPRAYSMHAAQY